MRYNKKDSDSGVDTNELFTASKDFARQVDKGDRSVFSTWLSNKTVECYPAKHVRYTYIAIKQCMLLCNRLHEGLYFVF